MLPCTGLAEHEAMFGENLVPFGLDLAKTCYDEHEPGRDRTLETLCKENEGIYFVEICVEYGVFSAFVRHFELSRRVKHEHTQLHRLDYLMCFDGFLHRAEMCHVLRIHHIFVFVVIIKVKLMRRPNHQAAACNADSQRLLPLTRHRQCRQREQLLHHRRVSAGAFLWKGETVPNSCTA